MFDKTVGYKVNIQKLKAFLYTNNEISETEIRKKVPLKIATRAIVYIGIHLNEEVKDLYSKSIYHVHGLEELTSSKCPYYPKQFIDSMQPLSKCQ